MHILRLPLVFLFSLLLLSCSGGSGGGSGSSSSSSSSSSSNSSSSGGSELSIQTISCGDNCSVYQRGSSPINTSIRGFVETASGTWFAPIIYNEINWGVIRSSDAGENWALVDNYQSYHGAEAAPQDMVIDNQSRIYVCGAAKGSPDFDEDYAWILRQSNDQGNTFEISDQLSVGDASFCNGLTLAPDGHGVYSFGQYHTDSDTGLTITNLVRFSNDGGENWRDIYLATGLGILDLKIAPTGDIYLLDNEWHLIRGDSTGQNWQTGVVFDSGAEQIVNDMAIAADGTIYVVGLAEDDFI